MLGDTIAALSTPRGKGGVALLRVSGPDALAVSNRVFTPKNSNKKLSEHPRTAVYGTLYAFDGTGEPYAADDGIAIYFPAPASFTGEETVELTCHGGMLLTQTLLEALFVAGARPAEAGEFTKRAFLNGKLGLSAAEALGNMLEAQTKSQLSLAYNAMGGALGERVERIYGSIRRILASIYAKIDYPDEDLADLSREEILSELNKTEGELSSLVHTYHAGHAVAEGISTVLCGKPNAGKSSLYNRILGSDAAIVTDIAGTTRDVLSSTASLGRVTLRLFDTAGLRDTDDAVEQIGVTRAREAIADAELILAVFDLSTPIDAEDEELITLLKETGAASVVVLNKSDAALAETLERLLTIFPDAIELSAKSGEGFEALEAHVEALFLDGAIDLRHDALLSNARQHAAALSSLTAVRRAIAALENGIELDMCCNDAEQAMASLCEIDGRAVSGDIVSEIFSHFCVGK